MTRVMSWAEIAGLSLATVLFLLGPLLVAVDQNLAAGVLLVDILLLGTCSLSLLNPRREVAEEWPVVLEWEPDDEGASAGSDR